ncbi:MAG TPA: transglycosylase SLT domain-containing protein [Saprospiraceae bacterium]|nr:transglycosylase SLT domain-containing protein [Saprospiraceae bacterium]HPI08836.1 transglycosylase SLT domain-containing protein [Saprospiraceae bacterium]
MQCKSFIVSLVALLSTLFSATLSAQSEIQVADLDDPIDTADMLVAKGGSTFTDAQLKQRLSQLSSCVELRTTGVVKGYIKTYVQTKTEKSRTMLGRRLTYFPLFEQKLKEYGLPTDLKYLSVVESALNAKAVSRVGATGLWQFMPYTGSDYGLRTNSAVEDRSNPVKSTDAAARYLKSLYKQFDDWALALAAYNSGPTRVNSAIRRAGSRNFWSIQRFLPEETRNYVPAFIAATYVCNYYNLHGLRPYEPDLDEQLTDYILVYEGISFRDIAEATGLTYASIKNLNPGFRRDYVPPSNDGHYVVVPQRVMPAFVRYLNGVSSVRKYIWENNEGLAFNSSETGDGRYFQTTISVNQPEHIDAFAQKYGLCGDQICAWNKLNSSMLVANQVLTLWRPVIVQKHTGGIKVEAPGAKIQAGAKPQKETGKPAKPASGLASQSTNAVTPASAQPRIESYQPKVQKANEASFQFHTVRRNESLEDIARQYATSVESLRKLNNFDTAKFGMRIKIRQF